MSNLLSKGTSSASPHSVTLPPASSPPASSPPPSLLPPSPPPGRPLSSPVRPLLYTIVALCFILIALDRSELIPIVHSWVLTLYEWFIVLSAFGLLVGVVNVFYLHLTRIAIGQPAWGYSLALVTTGLATLVAGLLQPDGVTSPTVEWIFDTLLAPGEASLFALTLFFLAAAAFRYLRFSARGGGWMVAGALLMLVIQMPASVDILPPIVGDFMDWLLAGPMMATFRGAVLGSALALFLIGVRFVLGRPQP